MQAAILSIGDELARGQILDTNAAWLASRLGDLDVSVVEHRTVADDRVAIADSITQLAATSGLLLVTGGLGPTRDDLTRFALGDVVDPGRDLVEDAPAMRTLESWFAGRGGMPESNRLQAMRPPSSAMIDNPHGTAPGLRADVAGTPVVIMPGPPREMRPMFEAVIEPLVRGVVRHASATAFVAGIGCGEAKLAERLGELMERDRNPRIGTTASRGIVTARILATAATEQKAADLAEEAAEEVLERWRPYAYRPSGEDLGVAAAVGRRLAQADLTLTTCESCTGGLVGAAATEVPGSSAWYRGGWVTYDNAMKTERLGVPAALLAEYGAVSAETAAAMAVGGLERAPADHALSLTGIAGPGGATPGKPIGTVWIGHAMRFEREGAPMIGVRARRFRLRGDRATVRERGVTASLALLRMVLDGDEPAPPEPGDVDLLWEDSGAGREAAMVVTERLGMALRASGDASVAERLAGAAT